MGLCNHLQRVCLARYVTNHNNHEYLYAELNSEVCKILTELNNPLFQHNVWSGGFAVLHVTPSMFGKFTVNAWEVV